MDTPVRRVLASSNCWSFMTASASAGADVMTPHSAVRAKSLPKNSLTLCVTSVCPAGCPKREQFQIGRPRMMLVQSALRRGNGRAQYLQPRQYVLDRALFSVPRVQLHVRGIPQRYKRGEVLLGHTVTHHVLSGLDSPGRARRAWALILREACHSYWYNECFAGSYTSCVSGYQRTPSLSFGSGNDSLQGKSLAQIMWCAAKNMSNLVLVNLLRIDKWDQKWEHSSACRRLRERYTCRVWTNNTNLRNQNSSSFRQISLRLSASPLQDGFDDVSSQLNSFLFLISFPPFFLVVSSRPPPHHMGGALSVLGQSFSPRANLGLNLGRQ
jgi:hypothetical protein